MENHQHPSNNSVFGAPRGWDQRNLPCDALPVTLGRFGGVPSITSYWRPDAAELAILSQGGSVVLHVIGQGHPPVAMSVAAQS